MALPVDFKAIVTRLDAATLTQLVGRLLRAEADRHGMAADAVVVSDALTEADGGLDARIDDGPGESQFLPTGLSGFQFKAYKTKAVSRLDLPAELAKPGPTRILESGGTYVLVWQADLNDKQRAAAEATLQSEAEKITAGPRCQIWDATAIVALAEAHVAVVEAMELLEFGVVRGLPELEATLRVEDRPYESDDDRERAIEQIRTRAEGPGDDPTVVTVSGLAGTGKTRLVVEALNIDGLRDLTLYAGSADGLPSFVARIVRDERTSGILVVDELAEADQKELYDRLAASRGRWRMVAIVPQTTRRYRSVGARDVLVSPLSGDAMQRLVVATSGLNESQARTVAEAAQGFPELAFRLAEELQANPDLDLVRLAHLERPNEVLRRALPDDTVRRALKPLALFAGLGVDGELAYQLEAVADAFGHDPTQLRHDIDLELSRQRFVSAAGRYRSVSPTLVAIWVAVELIDETPELDTLIAGLPEPVQSAFYEQLELLGPEASQLGPALERLLDDDRFREPGPFDEAAGRFLRASAAVVPSQVAASIDSLLSKATPEQLTAVPRRDLVWALEILRWWPETWEAAVRNLLRLAEAENETWSNNATGTFKESFTVYLSGSTVPFRDRITWLERTVAAADDPDRLPFFADAAAIGLERHHSRAVVGFRGGGEPRDWQPKTAGELHEARTRAWSLLLDIVDRLPRDERSAQIKHVAQGLLTLVFEGLTDKAIEDIRARDWTEAERAQLLGTLNRVIRVDKQPQEVTAKLEELRGWLEGSGAAERLKVMLAAPVWDLYDERMSADAPPDALVELADAVALEGDIGSALAAGREAADPNTRFQFLRLVAERIGARTLGDEAARDVSDTAAIAAALSVGDTQGEGAWVDQTLTELSEKVPAEVPSLMTYAHTTPERVSLALDLVDAGVADARGLVALRGGKRILELPATITDRLLETIGAGGYFEGALGMVLQLVEAEDGDVPDWLGDRAWRLATAAIAAEDGDTMVEYYVKALVEADLFSGDQMTELWALWMRHRTGLVEELDDVLTRRSLEAAPEEMLPRIITLITDEAAGDSSFSLFVSRDLALLSQVASAVGVDTVWAALEPLNEREFRIAIHHMQWAGGRPDPLVERFLGSDRLAGYETEAYSTFFNTLGTVSGDYWRALEREGRRAQAWLDALTDPQAREWAAGLVQRYAKDVEWHRAREEEEDFRLGR